MEMYEEYIHEREKLQTIKTDKGFICYRFEFPFCWINDYFVKKEFRQDGHGYFLANQVFQICKDAGIKTVQCQTDDLAQGANISKFTITNFGFEEIKKKDTVTTYSMEVSEWEKH